MYIYLNFGNLGDFKPFFSHTIHNVMYNTCIGSAKKAPHLPFGIENCIVSFNCSKYLSLATHCPSAQSHGLSMTYN